MRKKLYLLLIGILFFPSLINATNFKKTDLFERGGGVLYYKALTTHDNGYVAYGAYGLFYSVISRFDSNGNLLWEKIGDGFGGGVYKVIEDKDRNLVAVGNGGDCCWYTISKYDDDGNVLWKKSATHSTYGNSYAQSEYSDIAEYNDTYLVTGYHDNYDYEFGIFENRGVLDIYNFDGTRVSRHLFDESEFNEVNNILLVDDGYVLVGKVSSNIRISKYNFAHNLIWTNLYEDGEEVSVDDFDVDSDGNFVITGTERMSNDYYKPLILKYDTDGSFVENIRLGFSYFSRSDDGLSLAPRVFVDCAENDEILISFTDSRNGGFYRLNKNHEVVWKDGFYSDYDYQGFYWIGDFVESTNGFKLLKNFISADASDLNDAIVGSLVQYSEFENQEIFKSGWVGKSDFTNTFSRVRYRDDAIFSNSYSTTKNGFVLSQIDSDRTKSVLTTYDLNGELTKLIEIPGLLIVNLISDDNNIYVLALNDNQDSVVLLKFDYNLNKVSEVDVSDNADFILYLTEKNTLNPLRLNNDNVYIVNEVEDIIYEYDSQLKLSQDILISNNQSILNEVYPEIKEISINPDNVILGFDKSGEFELIAYKNFKGTFIKVFKGDEVIVNKKIDYYSDLSGVEIVDNYIVSVGYLEGSSIYESKIIVMDMECNILQIIENELGYFHIAGRDNSFVSLGVNKINCEDGSTCVNNHLDFFYLTLNIEKVDSKNGIVELSGNAKPGERISFIVTPKSGYIFDSLKIIDEDGNITIVNGDSFIMPEGNITVEPIFVVENPNTSVIFKLGFVFILIFIIYNTYKLRRIKVSRYSLLN